MAVYAGIAEDRVQRMMARVDSWQQRVPGSIPTTDPADPSFTPIRYWRGPVWVLVNWLVAEGLHLAGEARGAARLRVATRALVEEGYSEYYDPRTSAGIGGHGFSWSAALTLAWLTR